MNWNPAQMVEFTVLQPEQVIDQVRELIQTEALKQAQVARELGVAGSTLSQVLTGTYRGNTGEMSQRMVRWLQQRGRQKRAATVIPAIPKFIDTATAQQVIEILDYAQLFDDIGVVYSGAGLGKTSAVEEYRRRNPDTVWVVTCSPDCASVGVFLEETAMAVGITGAALHPAKLRREIVRRVRGTRGLLIVDEAQHLTKLALEAARSIHDSTNVGLVLLGNAQVYRRVYGSNTEKEDFAQLFSRIGIRLKLARPKAGDVHAIAEAFGITGRDCLEYLETIARHAGALRGVVKTIRLAYVMAAEKDGPIARTDLVLAWKRLQGGDLPGAEQAG